MGIQRRQLRIEIHQSHQQRDAQIDEHPDQRRADGLSGLALPLRPLGAAVLPAGLKVPGVEAPEAAEIAKVSKVEGKWHNLPPIPELPGIL